MSLVRGAAALAAVASLVLVGCGGGGGGTSAAPQAAAPKPLVISVKINGADSTAADNYTLQQGDTVEVAASAASSWTSANSNLQAQGGTSSTTSWKAHLVKAQSEAGTLTLDVSAGSDSTQKKRLTFVVPSGDVRNGNYKVYASNGSRYTLALDFDASTYALSGSNVGDANTSGTFRAVASETGSFEFASTRITSTANTARFRLNGETVVGAFPFGNVGASPAVYSVKPFFASRALELDQTALDGVYNRFGIAYGASLASDITQIRISGGGTVYTHCPHLNIYVIDKCPAETVTRYTIKPGATNDTWQLVNASGGVVGSFALAKVGNQHVFLIAGADSTGSTDALFRIGVPDSKTWPVGASYGGATPGSWGRVDMQASTSTRNGFATDGTAISTSNVYTGPSPTSDLAQNIRYIDAGSQHWFAMQGAGLFAIVGANASGTAGYFQLNLMD